MTAREQALIRVRTLAAADIETESERLLVTLAAEVESLTAQLAEAKAHPDPNNIWTEAADDARVMAQGRAESLAFKVTVLTAQLRAAQATIAATKAAWFGPCKFDLAIDGPKVSDALSRADTSALAEHDRQVAAKALRDWADYQERMLGEFAYVVDDDDRAETKAWCDAARLYAALIEHPAENVDRPAANPITATPEEN